jgi:hypothetical protein
LRVIVVGYLADASGRRLGTSQSGNELYRSRSHGRRDMPLMQAPSRYSTPLANMCISLILVDDVDSLERTPWSSPSLARLAEP